MINKHGKQFASRAEQRRYEAARPNAALEAHVAEDCFVRHTDKEGGKHVAHHRVWNRDRFAKALAAAARQVGGRAKAELITEGAFHSERDSLERRGARPDSRSARRK